MNIPPYAEKKKKDYTLKLRAMLEELPPCCKMYFRGIEDTTTVLTRYGYAIDLKTFFHFLIENISVFKSHTSITTIELSELNQITTTDIEIFLEHITLYTNADERTVGNKERAKARKLSTLRSFYKYFYKKELLTTTPPSLVDAPKLHEKPIIRLEPNEVADLLDTAEQGDGLSDVQKRYHKYTKTRDIAILTLFLGTGIRISELVGINLDDINFISNEFRVTRKGGNQDTLVFGNEVRQALLQYMLEREGILAAPGHESALFLSMQKKRITNRSVENLVKKYAQLAAPLKKISPHKLRSTYGTMLYRETGDIYLVADILGHKDVNTTRKHYAAVSEDRRRYAANKIKLRDDPGHEGD